MPVCQASPPCVPHSLPSPEALPRRESRATGFIVNHALPEATRVHCPPHSTSTPAQTPTQVQVHPCPRHGARSPLHLVLYGAFLEGDPILLPPTPPSATALAGSGAARRALAWTEAGPVCSEADELQARCRAAAGEERQRAAVMRYHRPPV